jgi:hypothetical protein
MAQVLEYLPSKHEFLSSSYNTAKKKKNFPLTKILPTVGTILFLNVLPFQ